jgi:hypothetical protein
MITLRARAAADARRHDARVCGRSARCDDRLRRQGDCCGSLGQEATIDGVVDLYSHLAITRDARGRT